MDPLSQRRQSSHLPYSPPLDGIRSIAILGVLIFHINPAFLPGGFTGVDVFFVLSGFLITSIILHDLKNQLFSFKEFYLRRIQRLLPNTIVTIAVTLLLFLLFLPDGMAIQPAQHGIWTLFNLSNFYIWLHLGDYWGASAEWSPFTHFWSLGVEEQFYLLFPATLLVLARFLPRQTRRILILGALFSFLIGLYGTYTHPTFTFYHLPTRVWELLLGSILALVKFPLIQSSSSQQAFSKPTLELLSYSGLALILASFILPAGLFEFPGWVALLPAIGSALVILSISAGTSSFSKFLSAAPLVGIGKLSYSLYLWHWPLIIFGKYQADLYGFPTSLGAVLGGLAGIILSILAYFLVERPLRKRTPMRALRLLVIAIAFSSTTIFCIFLARQPLPHSKSFDPVTNSGKCYDNGNLGGKIVSLAPNCYDVEMITPPPRPPDTWKTGGIIHSNNSTSTPRVMVFGSSHALMYSKLIDDICRTHSIPVSFYGMEATSAFFNVTKNHILRTDADVAAFNAARKKYLHLWKPDILFIIGRWESPSLETFQNNLNGLLSEIKDLPTQVIFVSQCPVPNIGELNFRLMIDFLSKKTDNPVRIFPDSGESGRKQFTAAVEAFAKQNSKLTVIRPDLLFYNPDGSIRYAEGRTFFYADDDHLSDAGADQARPLFEKAILDAIAKQPLKK